MRDKTIRTVGATVVLLGIAIAAAAQMGSPEGDPSAISLATEATPSTETTLRATTSTTEPDPFVYRIGVLADTTTDNYWAFYGEQPSVWNSYILGPTKPALYRIDPASGSLVPELAEAMATPTRGESGWSVTVELNDSFAWSDGEPITADDIVFTFETVRDAGLGGSWATAFPESVSGIEARGPHSVHILFSKRPNLSDWPHAVGTAPLMAEHVWRPQTVGMDQPDIYELGGASDVGGRTPGDHRHGPRPHSKHRQPRLPLRGGPGRGRISRLRG